MLSYRVVSLWEVGALWLGGAAGAVVAFFAAHPQGGALSLTAVLALVMFGITGLAVVYLRASTTPAVARLKAAGYFGNLISWGRSAAIAALVLFVIALFGMMAPSYAVYKHIFFAAVGGAGFAFIRLFWTILKLDISKSEISPTHATK